MEIKTHNKIKAAIETLSDAIKEDFKHFKSISEFSINELIEEIDERDTDEKSNYKYEISCLAKDVNDDLIELDRNCADTLISHLDYLEGRGILTDSDKSNMSRILKTNGANHIRCLIVYSDLNKLQKLCDKFRVDLVNKHPVHPNFYLITLRFSNVFKLVKIAEQIELIENV